MFSGYPSWIEDGEGKLTLLEEEEEVRALQDERVRLCGAAARGDASVGAGEEDRAAV
jgi:hypothetical protein